MTETDKKYIANLMPEWAKDVPRGLCATMYGTGSYDGDMRVKSEVERILGITGVNIEDMYREAYAIAKEAKESHTMCAITKLLSEWM